MDTPLSRNYRKFFAPCAQQVDASCLFYKSHLVMGIYAAVRVWASNVNLLAQKFNSSRDINRVPGMMLS